MKEKLYDILNFPSYQITASGKIWSKLSNIFLRPYLTGRGYLCVTLRKDGCSKIRPVHILVLETFIGLRPKGKDACHKNDNKLYNVLGNLYWGTRSDNHRDAYRNGKRTHKGENHPQAKLNSRQVRIIRQLLKHPKEFTQKEIGEFFNVCRSTVKEIKSKRNWKHL